MGVGANTVWIIIGHSQLATRWACFDTLRYILTTRLFNFIRRLFFRFVWRLELGSTGDPGPRSLTTGRATDPNSTEPQAPKGPAGPRTQPARCSASSSLAGSLGLASHVTSAVSVTRQRPIPGPVTAPRRSGRGRDSRVTAGRHQNVVCVPPFKFYQMELTELEHLADSQRQWHQLSHRLLVGPPQLWRNRQTDDSREIDPMVINQVSAYDACPRPPPPNRSRHERKS